MTYLPIESHGVVGDLSTVALVGLDGTIDFMCLPQFDSPTVFASLLDSRRGGFFRIAPTLEEGRHRQLYLPETNVLLTRFLSGSGVSELSDFMPVQEFDPFHTLVRRVKTVRGRVAYRMVCAPRFDYARAGHAVHRSDGGVVFESRGADRTVLRLTASVPVSVDQEGAATASFELEAGRSASFVLEQVLEGRPPPARDGDYVARSFKRTVNYWRGWVRRTKYAGRWREMVHRSALTLKMLVSARHGSLVAAPTFGLPETIGGERNWDYRYTWIRDASFTLYALIRLGFTVETTAFMRWIEQRCEELGEGGGLQTVYGLDGRRELPEIVLGGLEGYRASAPVRIGNAAHRQLQLDIYGELMDAVYLHDKYGERISHSLWKKVSKLVDWVCEHWQLADEGIWEVRGPRQQFLYSRLLCWVAVDRGIRLALKRSLPAPLDRWICARDALYTEIFDRFWSSSKRSFVQRLGSQALDAACLVMPLMRFISPTDPRWLSTLRAVRRELVEDSLVYRYRTEEGPPDVLSGAEGTFCLCTFWYAECLSRSGDVEMARFIFEKMLGYANHLGLYAEEIGPTGEHLGNFPQAFTHLALISAAYNLDARLSARDGRGAASGFLPG
ncbi:MAG TPA: glycoside hydrolase family 15 protein [Candidatus Polarisedimenticolia bacterium]|nr:glycoside hydrolase family 15 protein [Candidatus Polarisedimenticolia bacterium]